MALALGALAGCPSTHEPDDAGIDAGTDAGPPDSGVRLWVDGDRRLVELTDDEWWNLCEWRASLFESPTYYCDGTNPLGPDAEACSDCNFHDWRPERCFDPIDHEAGIAGEVAVWRSEPTFCRASVSIWGACMADLAALRCADSPSCDALACPDEPPDAGGPDAGP